MLNQAPSGSYLCLSKQYSGPSAASISFVSDVEEMAGLTGE